MYVCIKTCLFFLFYTPKKPINQSTNQSINQFIHSSIHLLREAGRDG